MRRSWLRLFWAGVLVTAAGIGYLVSSGLGTQLLHREIERQLGRLLAGPVTIERVEVHFDTGLAIEAFGFQAYPRQPDPLAPAALRARRVLAGIDSLALLIGRLELRSLLLDEPHLRIERDTEGELLALPLPRLHRRPSNREPSSTAELWLQRLESIDAGALALLGRSQVARRIEIRDGTIHWIDRRAAHADGAPLELRLELVQGHLDRDWLSEALRIEASAILVDGRHTPFPVEIALARDEGRELEWSLSVSKLVLDGRESLPGVAPGIDALHGRLAATAQLARGPAGGLRLDLRGRLDEAVVALASSGAPRLPDATFGHVEWGARIDLDRDRIRFTQASLEMGHLALAFEGAVDRPIRLASRSRLDARWTGLVLEDLRALARSIAAQGPKAPDLSKLLEAIRAGRLESFDVAGSGRLHQWRDLLDEDSQTLPVGLIVGGRFEEVSIATGEGPHLEDLQGTLEWSGDQLIVRALQGTFRGRPLPRLDAVLDGVSHLLQGPAEREPAGSWAPPPLPGLSPLLELIQPRDRPQPAPVQVVRLALDHLHHPIFGRPLEDLRIQLEPRRDGLEVFVERGRWGELPFTGELVYLDDRPTPAISARVTLDPARQAVSSNSGPTTLVSGEAQTEPPERWAAGHLELAFRPDAGLPWRRASGFLRLEDGMLRLSEIEVQLEPQGEVAARALLDLTREGVVGVDLSFALIDGLLQDIGPAAGLPRELATGAIQASGSLHGDLRPGSAWHSGLEGEVRAEARAGRVRMRVPLFMRLSRASEGYNPFADADELDYESMTATFGLDRGLLSTADFSLEGPLRVFATGRIETGLSPVDIRAIVGIFLFRAPNQVLETLPLVRSFLPGSDRGLMGTYFEVSGPIGEPDVEPLAIKSLLSGVPDVIKAPFKVLRLLFDRTKGAP